MLTFVTSQRLRYVWMSGVSCVSYLDGCWRCCVVIKKIRNKVAIHRSRQWFDKVGLSQDLDFVWLNRVKIPWMTTLLCCCAMADVACFGLDGDCGKETLTGNSPRLFTAKAASRSVCEWKVILNACVRIAVTVIGLKVC